MLVVGSLLMCHPPDEQQQVKHTAPFTTLQTVDLKYKIEYSCFQLSESSWYSQQAVAANLSTRNERSSSDISLSTKTSSAEDGDVHAPVHLSPAAGKQILISFLHFIYNRAGQQNLLPQFSIR